MMLFKIGTKTLSKTAFLIEPFCKRIIFTLSVILCEFIPIGSEQSSFQFGFTGRIFLEIGR